MKKVFDQFNDFCFFNMDDVLVQDTSKTDNSEHLSKDAENKVKLAISITDKVL